MLEAVQRKYARKYEIVSPLPQREALAALAAAVSDDLDLLCRGKCPFRGLIRRQIFVMKRRRSYFSWAPGGNLDAEIEGEVCPYDKGSRITFRLNMDLYVFFLLGTIPFSLLFLCLTFLCPLAFFAFIFFTLSFVYYYFAGQVYLRREIGLSVPLLEQVFGGRARLIHSEPEELCDKSV